ncbi:MAG: hypothetical protein IJG82_09550 [Atopobiaceae bacterium]|nr:hypothetical protein [Atopobiaceae bacterium]
MSNRDKAIESIKHELAGVEKYHPECDWVIKNLKRRIAYIDALTDEGFEHEQRREALSRLKGERFELLDELWRLDEYQKGYDEYALEDQEWRAYLEARVEYLDRRIAELGY